MKLKAKVTILRKRSTPSSIVQSLEIFLNDQTKIMLFLQRPTSSHKFRHNSEKIVRVLNMYKRGINFLRVRDCYDTWTSWEWEETEKEFEIWSSDLSKIKFSGEQRKIVKRALDGNLKSLYTRNPSKPKSQMEYRKRAYYGKCKK